MYDNLPLQCQMFGFDPAEPLPVDHYLDHGQELKVGPFKIKVIHSPGHSPGSVCFLLEEHKVVFTGDTLFRQGIGRTDLWGGSYEEIMGSLTDRILVLDDSLLVVPGHGPTTTIGDERAENPFVQGV